jgi:hypothetical protein
LVTARAALLLLGAAGCAVSPLSGVGRPCSSAQPCGGGTVCDPVAGVCVAVLERGVEAALPDAASDRGASDRSVDALGERGPEAGPPASPFIVSSGGWGWHHPLPQGNTLRAVHALGATDAWAVGAGGTILRFDGNRWHAWSSGTNEDLHAVWAASATEAWAGGDAGTLLRFDGTSWTPHGLPGPSARILSLFGLAASDVWLGTGSATLFHFDGSAWLAVTPTSGAAKEVTGIWGADPMDVWFATGKDLLRLQATAWTKFGSKGTEARAIWGTSATDIWAGGDSLLHFDGSGEWNQAGGGQVSAIWGQSATELWTAGPSGAMQQFKGSWSSLPTLTTLDLHGLGGAGGRAWAVGDQGVMLRRDATWTLWGGRVATRALRGVWGPPAPSTLLWVVGETGTLLHFDGASWSAVSLSTQKHLNGIWGSSAASIVAVGDGGTVLRFDGSQWSAGTAGTSATLNAVHGCSASDLWAVGGSCTTDCSVLPCVTTCEGVATHFDGSTWKATKVGSKVLRGVLCHPLGVFAVGDGGAVVRWDPGASSWKGMSASTSAALHAIAGVSATEAWAAGSGGTLLRYTAGSWSSASSGTSALLQGLWGSSGSDVWASGSDGLLLHFDGTGWSPVPSGATASLRALWGRGAKDLWTVGDGAAVLHYDDRIP